MMTTRCKTSLPCDTEKPDRLDGGSNFVHGYMVMDAGANMLAQMKAACLNAIECLEHMLQLVMKDAVGVRSHCQGHLGCCFP